MENKTENNIYEITSIEDREGLRKMVLAKSLDGQEIRFKLKCLAKDLQRKKDG